MKGKHLESLSDIYAKGGYWGCILGVTVSGASYNWNGNRIAWGTSVCIVLAIYLYHLYRIHKHETSKVT